MQLEPQIISFMRFSAPEYQYKPQGQKLSQNKYLEMYYKTNPDTCFVQLVETLFSDRYLYEHKPFRTLVSANNKGYVHTNDIFAQELIVKFLQQMGDDRPQIHDVLFLIKKLSTKLVCNRNQVRRKFPFVNKLRESKPLYIEEYPQNDGNQELETLLENTSNIYKINYTHAQNWGTVYAQDPDSIVKLNGNFWSIKTYFRVMNYEKAMHEFDNALLSTTNTIIKLQSRSVFDQLNNCDELNLEQRNRHQQRGSHESDGSGGSSNECEDEQMRCDQERQRYCREMAIDKQGNSREVEIDRNKSRMTMYYKKKQKAKGLRQEKVKFFEPNFELNCSLLSEVPNNQRKVVISGEEMKGSKLSREKEDEIDGLLMQFYEQKMVKIASRKREGFRELNGMQVE